MMSIYLNMRKKAALALAGAMIFSSAASAIPPPVRDPVCDQQVANGCVATWQALGYWNYEHCVGHRQCTECPPLRGYLCGPGPYDATRSDVGTEPW